MRFRNGRYRKDDILEATFLCDQSKGKRTPYYRRCKDLYLYGGDPLLVSRANKIKPTINAQASFLYAPQSISFWLSLPPHEEDEPGMYDRVDPTSDNLLLQWHDSKTGRKFKWCVNWALVYGATIMATLPRFRTDLSVEVSSFYVHPQDFGVADDLQPDMDEQEAVSLTSYFPLSQISRMLQYNERKDKIMKNLMIANKLQPGFEGMISTPPNASVFDIKPEFWKWYYQSFDYQPTPAQMTYEWKDIYAWDDELEDYRIFTVSGDEVIWDRPMSYCGIPGMLPFVKVCADEHPEWFWGISLADDLAKLQLWYAGAMDNLDTLMDKIADPPVAAIGVGQTFDEKLYQFKKKSGKLTLPPGADIKSFQPDVPQQMFEFIAGIDTMMDEQAGHKPSMVGKEGAGGKSGQAVAAMMRVAGSQMMVKAYEIESCCQQAAKLLLSYGQRYDNSYLLDEQGNKFLMADLPPDVKVRVGNHSNSPIFVQDSFEIGMALHRSQAITDEMLLRLANIPQLDRAIHDLRVIGYQKNMAKYMVEAMQQAKRSGQLTGAKG